MFELLHRDHNIQNDLKETHSFGNRTFSELQGHYLFLKDFSYSYSFAGRFPPFSNVCHPSLLFFLMTITFPLLLFFHLEYSVDYFICANSSVHFSHWYYIDGHFVSLDSR